MRVPIVLSAEPLDLEIPVESYMYALQAEIEKTLALAKPQLLINVQQLVAGQLEHQVMVAIPQLVQRLVQEAVEEAIDLSVIRSVVRQAMRAEAKKAVAAAMNDLPKSP